jgi:hypothetical protein
VTDSWEEGEVIYQQGRLLDALKALVAVEPVAAGDLAHYCVYCEGLSGRPSDTGVIHAPDCVWVAAKALVEEVGE